MKVSLLSMTSTAQNLDEKEKNAQRDFSKLTKMNLFGLQ